MMAVFRVLLLLILLQGSEAAFLGPNRSTRLPSVGSFPTVGSVWVIDSSESDSDSQPASSDNEEKSLVDLLLPSKNCKVDQMSGTDLGTFSCHRSRYPHGI